MIQLINYNLTYASQLVALLYPFIFFVYRASFNNSHIFQRRADIIYFIISGLTLFLLFYRLYLYQGDSDFQNQLLTTIQHALPFVLSIFMVGYITRTEHSTYSIQTNARYDRIQGRKRQPLNESVEKLSWDDLIIQDSLSEELRSIINLLRDPKTAQSYGIEIPKGILLSGPPGTGKTTIAKVMANEAGLAFFALQLDDVISKWVGESEKNLTALFNDASENAPAILFIDEIDSIGKQRSGSGGQEHRETFLNHLLQLMDGVIKCDGLYIVAATNRADLVDSALKRPGRLNKVIEIGLPDLQARIRLFELYLSKLKLEAGINPKVLAELTERKSPAVIREICNQAGLNAYKRESISGTKTHIVTLNDIQSAINDFI